MAVECKAKRHYLAVTGKKDCEMKDIEESKLGLQGWAEMGIQGALVSSTPSSTPRNPNAICQTFVFVAAASETHRHVCF